MNNAYDMPDYSVSDERLHSCIQVLARIMEERWQKHRCLAFTPILERLEREVEARQQVPPAIQRARAYLVGKA